MVFFPRFVTDNGATFDNDSERDALYRYELWRRWDMDRPILLFVMLNPSTAGATENDRTINRCIDFAKRLGYGGIRVVNLFAYRATQPDWLFDAVDPVGPKNDDFIRRNVISVVENRGCVCLAWGKPLRLLKDRHIKVYQMLVDLGVDLYVLGTTDDGHPRHPLYMPASSGLKIYGVQRL